jgi:hypothetical protein
VVCVRRGPGGSQSVHHAAVGTEVVEVEDPFGLDNGPAEATERILAARRRGDGGGEAVLGGVVDDSQIRQIPPRAVSNSERSICQTRFRRRGGSRNTRFRIRADDLRSARNPVGSSSPRRRRAR